jgi:hypothetical protein
MGGESRAGEEITRQVQNAFWSQEAYSNIVTRLEKAHRPHISFVLGIRCSVSSIHTLLRPSDAFFWHGCTYFLADIGF